MTSRATTIIQIQPRGLRRDDAAAYLSLGTTKFDEWVARGLLPKPKKKDGVVVWDRLALDRAFTDLPETGANRIDEALAGRAGSG
jgi:predicted DNA-binding transcriptional regulator AlpA